MEFTEFERQFPVPLNEQQREAVRAVDGPTLLLAVPGSGKTTVLVARLGYMIYVCGIAPENILTVTYTVAATRDMRRRFASFFGQETADRLEFRTINGICAKIIDQYSRMIGKRPFSLVTNEKKTAAVLSGIWQDVQGEWPTEGDLRDVRTQITYIKNMMLTGEEIRGGRTAPDRNSEINIAEIYRRYSRWLRENSLMDYDDQMVYALTMLRRSPELLGLFQDRFRYICVDEAQDTSKIQHVLLALLASRHRNIFMVGDEDQSIYGFRAAFPEALTEFEKNYPGARVLLMEENFRSGGAIVGMADRFIRRNTLRHEKSMRTSKAEDAQVREISLRGRRAQYTYLVKAAESCTEAYRRLREEEADVGTLHEGAGHAPATHRYTGPVTAVLYRNNESAVGLVDRLDREGIPFRIRNAEISFFTHRTVEDVKAVLRLSLNSGDTESFLRIYYKFGLYLKKEQALRICEVSRGLGVSVMDAALGCTVKTEKGIKEVNGLPGLSAAAKKAIKTFRTHLRRMKKSRGDEAVERIVRDMGYGEYLGGNGLSDSRIFTLRTIGMGTDSPKELLERLDQLYEIFSSREMDPGCPFVLSTIHASKGLEYDTVYLMDVTDGTFPEKVPDDTGRMSPGERAVFEEERRIFYVGVTRAKNRLNIFTFPGLSVFSDEFFEKCDNAEKENGNAYANRGASRRGGITDLLKDMLDEDPRSDGRGQRGGNSGGRSGTGRRGLIREENNYRMLSRNKKVPAGELEKYINELGPGLAVTHVSYGEGAVVDLDDRRIRIRFEDRERVFNIETLCAGKLLKF